MGSSAKTMSGRPARARATATRCCWPPESSLGRCLRRSLEADGGHDEVEPHRVGLAAGQVHRERDVLEGRERRHQVERLEDEAEAVAPQLRELLVVQRGEVDVADEHLALGELVEPGEGVHERRLAGAGRAHDGGELPGVELDVDAVEGPDLRSRPCRRPWSPRWLGRPGWRAAAWVDAPWGAVRTAVMAGGLLAGWLVRRPCAPAGDPALTASAPERSAAGQRLGRGCRGAPRTRPPTRPLPAAPAGSPAVNATTSRS